MKKKIYIIFGILSIIFLIWIFILKSNTNTVTTTNPVIPTISPIIETLPNDLEFSRGLTDLHEKYPWYSKLPIENEDYRIIYDFDTNSFRIRLLTESTEIIKNAALNNLKSIGVDITITSYYFLE